jgi:hypothetical protein
MSTYKITGGDQRGSIFGDNATQNNNQVLTGEDKSARVEELLSKLQAEVEALAGQLPPQHAEQVKSDLEVLAKEAKSPQPRRKMFEVTGEGLVDAAKTVATMAPSITAAVLEIGKLIFS